MNSKSWFSSRFGRWLGPVVSVLALAGVVKWMLAQDAPRFSPSASDIAELGLGLVFVAVAMSLRGWRWHSVMRHAGVNDRLRDALELTAVGYMGNNVLPARGGELLRIVLMSRKTGARPSEVAGSIIGERLLDMAVLVVLLAALTWTGVASKPVGDNPPAIAFGLLVLATSGLFAYLWLRRRGRFERFAAMIRPIARASRLLLGRVGVGLAALSLLIWAIEGLIFFLVGQSLGADITYAESTMIAVLASFFGMIPAAPGYVGTFDAGMILGLSAIGVTDGVAVSYILLVRFIEFVPITVVGFGFMVAHFGGLANWRKERRKAALELETPP